MRVICGIYGLVNTTNGKTYVGSSIDIWGRTGRHLTWLRSGTHWNTHLQAAYRLGQRFATRVLEKCLSEQLLDREDFWIEKLGTLDNRMGYNMSPAVRKTPSEDGRRRISESRKGKAWEEIYGVEQATNLREGYADMFGGVNNPMYGRSGDLHPFWGKTTEELFGKEIADKMAKATSISQKGKQKSPETRRKLSESHKGKVLTEEHRRAIGEAGRRNYQKVGKQTFEEKYGDRAEDIRARIAESVSQSTRGVTWEQKMGKEAAEARREKSRKWVKCQGCDGRLPSGRKWCRPCWLVFNRRKRG